MKRVKQVAMVISAMAAVGCSGSQETKSSDDPGAYQVPAQWQDGIYVAAYDGADSNSGTAYSPMRTINAAIQRAASEGKRDVWIYGGGFNAGYAEVVVLKAGINLRGSICKTDNPPAEADPSCASSIVGGSPSLVAIDIRENTIVENLEIVGLPGVQSGGPNDGFFEVNGIGCVGRGITNGRLPSCDRPVDKEGRLTPLSSVAVALSRSNAVYFRNVSVVAGDGANGLDGSEGAIGANSTKPANGLHAGDKEFKAGAGAKSIVNPSCPDSAGGKGGQGGRFRWKVDALAWSESACNPANTTAPIFCAGFFQTNFAHGGNNGEDSFLGTGAATIAPPYNGFQAGTDGRHGLSGVAGLMGDDGLHGFREIDLVSLTAGEGNRGDRGHSGRGGAGGSGGNPATVRIYEKQSTSSSGAVTIIGVAGSNTGANSSYELTAEVDGMAGGGGGAGGAGGCGGEGGTGGQGGASSVGIYLVDSVLGADATTVAAGRGGQGGRGGFGGIGGQGAQGSEGGMGTKRDALHVVGSLTQSSAGGMFVLSASSQSTQSWTNGLSASRGGKGGTGGEGGDGGNGGQGGAGAGGSSIGVVAKGASSITGAVTFELGEAGEPGAEDGEQGMATELLSL